MLKIPNKYSFLQFNKLFDFVDKNKSFSAIESFVVIFANFILFYFWRNNHIQMAISIVDNFQLGTQNSAQHFISVTSFCYDLKEVKNGSKWARK